MHSAHEQNMRSAERALENLRANVASGMPPDEILLRLDVECEAVDLEVYASYASEPEGAHPGAEEARYSSFMIRVMVAKSRARDYLDGKISADEALASISECFGVPLDRRADSDPAPTDDEGGAPRGPSPPPPKGAAPPADELISGYRRQFRESMNVAGFLLEIGKVEDPEGVEALENARAACGRMITFLEEQATVSEGLDEEEARLELAMVLAKVATEFAYVGTMMKVATRHMPKENRSRTGPTRSGARDPQGPRQAAAGQAPTDQAPHPPPPRQEPPRRPSPRYVPPPSPPFGMSPDTWRDYKLACGCILLFVVAGLLLFGCLIGVASG